LSEVTLAEQGGAWNRADADSKGLPDGGIMSTDESSDSRFSCPREKVMDRRLAAILAADMAGYSRLMEQNEDEVLVRQKAHRRELIDPEIKTRGGRIVKTTGDGMLVEFASAQDAVRCAISIQSAMVEREAQTAADNRITYRVGVNLGDVIFDDGDVFGDGVNVAARLQALSKPGGVCVSDIVHQTVGDRIREPFRDMGSQRARTSRARSGSGNGRPTRRITNRSWTSSLCASGSGS
jgi:class 3 adenylate cyclase